MKLFVLNLNFFPIHFPISCFCFSAAREMFGKIQIFPVGVVVEGMGVGFALNDEKFFFKIINSE